MRRTLLLFLVSLILCLTHLPSRANSLVASIAPLANHTVGNTSDARTQLQRAQFLYERGKIEDAIYELERTLPQLQTDLLGKAIAYSNLSLAYQQVGRWQEAEAAIRAGLALLQDETLPDRIPVLAQAFDIQGRLQLHRGESEAALHSWEQAEQLYSQITDRQGTTRSIIHQAEAMQALGLYRRAIATLTQLTDTLRNQPDHLEQAIALRSLGNALRIAGDLTQSKRVLQESVAIAQRLQNSYEAAIAQLNLANTLQALDDPSTASTYDLAIASGTPSVQLRARVNQIRWLIQQQQWEPLQRQVADAIALMERLPVERTAIESRIYLAHSLIRASRTASPQNFLSLQNSANAAIIRQLLTAALEQTQQLGDRRLEAFALGTLGEFYEQTNEWSKAQPTTETALFLSQQAGASDLTYLWEWQLGRLAVAEGDRTGAIAAYSNAVNTLQSLRNDLVTVNADVQFSFRDSVEPIHRELVSILLTNSVEPTHAELETARKTIESLQLAELDNFFREACLNARPIQIDQVDRRAAVLYPIILSDRLEVILSIPGRPLRHYAAQEFSQAQIEPAVNELRQLIVTRRSRPLVNALSQRLYDALIRPAIAELTAANISTLVFVPDGVLRNLPMSILFDGEHFLIEQFSVAIAPSLQLLESQPIQQQPLSILLAGLTQSRQGFSPLPNVLDELQKIQVKLPGRALVDEAFTQTALQAAINAAPSPIVHLATHGEFSSELENTFVLAWDDRITINQLNSLLQSSDLARRRPIELLVLSACQTANGDNRAALGLAGVAVRAGARSTLATLWSVSDDATPLLMERFYQELATGNVTKAEALRRSQLSLLQNPQFDRPYFWAPFVLVGNWL